MADRLLAVTSTTVTFITLSGSVGAKESIIENEMEISNLTELDAFFDKIASIDMHADWGKKFGEVIVSGSTYWEVLRVVE